MYVARAIAAAIKINRLQQFEDRILGRKDCGYSTICELIGVLRGV